MRQADAAGAAASEERMRGGGKLQRVAVSALAAFLLFAAAAELVLRFAFGLGNPILIQADPECEYFLKPDQNVFRFFVHTRTNQYGMRSDPFPLAHSAGALRILFVGDSITYGTTRVDQRDIFTEILHRDLPAIVNRPVEVLNASAGAWAPANELSFLRSRGLFHADLVVLVLNNGDLTQPRATVAEVGEDLPLKRPATAIGELCERYLRPRLLHLLRRGDAGDAMAASAQQITRENLADLDQIRQLAAAQGARMAIAYVPFRRDIPQPASAAENVFKAWADAHDLPIFDLTAAELPYTAQDITLDNGIHFNARGHAVVARAIEQSWRQVLASR